MWARGKTATEECPKSLISADSLALLEEFHVWKFAGGPVRDLPAKRVEGFVILEQEWRREVRNGE